MPEAGEFYLPPLHLRDHLESHIGELHAERRHALGRVAFARVGDRLLERLFVNVRHRDDRRRRQGIGNLNKTLLSHG